MTDAPEKTKGAKAREMLEQIKYAMNIGRITYDQAKDFAEPHLAILNAELQSRARKAGLSARKITFTGYMR